MPKDKSALPMLADIKFEDTDSTKQSAQTIDLTTNSPPTDLPPNAIVDRNGQWRDKDTGQLVKGTPGNDNSGRPRRMRMLDRLVRDKCGEDVEHIVNQLVEVAMYNPDVYDVDKDGKPVKRKSHYYNANHKMEAIKIIMAYYFGKPQEQKFIDIQKNVSITGKLASVAQLVTKNAINIKDLKNVTPRPINEDVANEIVEDIYDDASDE